MRKEIENILTGFDPEKENLLPVLKAISSERGAVSRGIARKVADYFSLPISQVFETASFYDLLETEEYPGILIEVCSGGDCCLPGSDDLIGEIENILKIREGDVSDPRFRLRKMSCVALCHEGPVVRIGKEIHTRMDKEKIREILSQYA